MAGPESISDTFALVAAVDVVPVFDAATVGLR